MAMVVYRRVSFVLRCSVLLCFRNLDGFRLKNQTCFAVFFEQLHGWITDSSQNIL